MSVYCIKTGKKPKAIIGLLFGILLKLIVFIIVLKLKRKGRSVYCT